MSGEQRMKKEYAQLIFQKCPLIYRGRNKGPKHNLMCFGFECSSGWFDMIFELSKKVEEIAETMKANGLPEDELPMVSQIKEKFGTLRFYMSSTTEEIQNLINQAEHASSQACEQCGKPGSLKKHGSRFLTVCDECEVNDEN